jgi:transcriptional regulator with XRE-family HTH domain
MHRIRHLREKRAWTQQHLADAAGLSRKTITRLEKGELIPAKETLMAVAAAFDVELADLQDPQNEWDELQNAQVELHERFTTHHETLDAFLADIKKTRAEAPPTEVKDPDQDEGVEEQLLWIKEVTDVSDIRHRRLRFQDDVTGRGFTLTIKAVNEQPEEIKYWFANPQRRELLAANLGFGSHEDPFRKPDKDELEAVQAIQDACEGTYVMGKDGQIHHFPEGHNSL